MPFGLAMSQDVFQYRVEQILEGCKGVISISDDIVVFGNSEQSHDDKYLPPPHENSCQEWSQIQQQQMCNQAEAGGVLRHAL